VIVDYGHYRTDRFSSRSTIGLSAVFGRACDLSGTMKLYSPLLA